MRHTLLTTKCFLVVIAATWLPAADLLPSPLGSAASSAVGPLAIPDTRLREYKPRKVETPRARLGGHIRGVEPGSLSLLLSCPITLPLRSRLIPPCVGISCCTPLDRWSLQSSIPSEFAPFLNSYCPRPFVSAYTA